MQIKQIRAIAMIWLLVALSLPNSCFGQRYWKKTYGGTGYDNFMSIQPAGDGNFFIVGCTDSYGKGEYDGWLLKIKPNGDAIWTKTYGGAYSDCFVIIQPTSDGNFLIAGSTSSYTTVNLGIWLIKIKPNGDTLWSKTFGGENNESFLKILPTSDGNYLIVGTKFYDNQGNTDGWLLKINPDGDTLWTRTFGGEKGDELISIQPISNGYFLITGITNSYGNGGSDVWLIKINSNGETIWSKTFGGAEDEWLSVMQPISDDNYLIACNTNSYGNGGYDVCLIKINPNGEKSRTKTYGGAYDDYFCTIQPTRDGNSLIAGGTSSNSTGLDGWLLKINQDGDTLWSKTYGGAYSDDFNNIQPTSDGNFLITGYTSSYSAGGLDSWLVKINQDGDTLWTKTYDRTEIYSLLTIFPDNNGNLLIIGYTIENSNTGDIDGTILCLIADQYAYKDSLFTFKIPTYDVDSLNCGYSPINVPSGMTVSTGGTVSWTPKTDSVYMDHAEFLIINDVGRKDSLSFNIFVNSDYHAPVFKKPSQIVKTTSKSFDIKATSLSGKVKFFLPSSASSLCIYDITGRMVDRIVPVISGSGTYAVWPNDPSRCSQFHVGKYFAMATMGKNSAVKPFVLVR